ncbi:hypothetical protein BV25DRAFT_1921185 [Artomyces pyxidatus]|uniref:Uncharacterized protein n=1 Tax=Artomyces pyxidatus TaxID=48021 RepID=A0ACB8SKE9_9AGAM|nr:hypothetical protein BV25DRAFT_1921185 [Artomyces pyxidatus]
MSNALFQNSYYIGNNFNCILYGVELVLYTVTMQKLMSLQSRKTGSNLFFICFSTANLALITVYVAVQSVFGEEMWIVNVGFPGGQGAYLQQFAAVWYQTMGTTASVVLNLLSDGLLIYRCFVVWSDVRIVILPGILYMATLALSIVELWASGAPHSDFFQGLAANFGLSYYATSIGLNVLVTCLIVARILSIARTSDRYLGVEISQTYIGIAAIIVESALPYTLAGIAFLVSYGMSSEISILFLSVYVMFTCVSPQMLLLRVVEGRAWRHNQFRDTTAALNFSNSGLPGLPGASDYTDSTTAGSAGAGDMSLRLQAIRKSLHSLEDAGTLAVTSEGSI